MRNKKKNEKVVLMGTYEGPGERSYKNRGDLGPWTPCLDLGLSMNKSSSSELKSERYPIVDRSSGSCSSCNLVEGHTNLTQLHFYPLRNTMFANVALLCLVGLVAISAFAPSSRRTSSKVLHQKFVKHFDEHQSAVDVKLSD